MNKILSVIAFAIILMMALPLSAQTNVFMNFAGAFPSGEFADGDDSSFGLITNDSEGGAGLGFNAGLKINVPVSVKGLSVMISLDGIYNGLNSELKEYFEDYVDTHESNYDEYIFKKPQYINVPVMAGLNYTYRFNDQIGLFAEAGLGPNLRIITKMEEYKETATYKTEDTRQYDPKISLAYQFGGGLEFNRRFIVGLSFYNLGSSKVKGKDIEKIKYKAGSSNTDTDKFSLKRVQPTILLLRLGFKL